MEVVATCTFLWKIKEDGIVHYKYFVPLCDWVIYWTCDVPGFFIKGIFIADKPVLVWIWNWFVRVSGLHEMNGFRFNMTDIVCINKQGKHKHEANFMTWFWLSCHVLLLIFYEIIHSKEAHDNTFECIIYKTSKLAHDSPLNLNILGLPYDVFWYVSWNIFHEIPCEPARTLCTKFRYLLHDIFRIYFYFQQFVALCHLVRVNQTDQTASQGSLIGLTNRFKTIVKTKKGFKPVYFMKWTVNCL